MDRAAFLARVADALGPRGAPAPARPAGDRAPRTTASGDDASPEAFAAALAAMGGVARTVDRDALCPAIAEEIRELRTDRRLVIAPDADELYARELRAAVEETRAEVLGGPPWRDAAVTAAMGVTSAAAAVASTGSLVLVPDASSPRVVSLLPPAHLAIVPAERLVAGLEDAMPILAASAERASSALLVTGPSRSSDIEMTMVLGVHGPKVLHVLLVR